MERREIAEPVAQAGVCWCKGITSEESGRKEIFAVEMLWVRFAVEEPQTPRHSSQTDGLFSNLCIFAVAVVASGLLATTQ
jgi:hypothetical protein